jgi:signal transduction histidine kinase/CheY-like chemotaxis protein/PAS domain-containing protein
LNTQGTTTVESRSAASRIPGPLLLVLTIAAVLTGCWLLYHFEARSIADQQKQRESTRVHLLAILMHSDLRPMAYNLRLLADGDGLRSYLATGSEAGLAAATRRAQFVSSSNPDYDRVRYIDEHGQEIVRVNQGGVVVPREQLRNQAERSYFQKTMALPPGGLYVSAIDLSIENGVMETPLKPALRLAVPVFDAAGDRRGIYIINLLAANLITHLKDAVPLNSHRLRLLNTGGYWLNAADPSQEWGFALQGRENATLAKTDPELWARMQNEESGQFEGVNGLFTWLRVSPAGLTGEPADAVVAEEPWVLVGAEVSRQEWQGLFAGVKKILYVLAPLLVAFTLLSAMLLRARRLVLVQLRASNQQLEQRVQDRTRELEKSYEELQQRESLLDETGNLAKVGGWEFDPLTGEGSWTPELARIHDVDASLKPSRDLGFQFFPGNARDRIEAAVQKSITEGRPYDLELEFISAKGVQKWVRTISRPVIEDGRVVRMRGAMQDISDRKRTELKLQSQLQRMNLLERTTRAIGERQDLASILQVVVRTLEEQMPLDFGCVCLYDPIDRMLTVNAIGVASAPLADLLSMPPLARIPIDENGLSRCVRGQLVYEADIAEVQFAFPQRLASGGLRAMVVAPLQIESQVFGVLIAARREPDSFDSSDCEFLRQMSEHAALAAHQSQLLSALQAAYEDMRNTQQAVMQQERLRVLGQMASGIAHDINNAISPIMLYTESLLEQESGLSERARQSLITIQQAVSDVAETVARMREFYRQRETQAELQPVQLNTLARQLRDLTRARWEAMPQRQGIVIDLRLELADNLPVVDGIESEIREALINLVFNAIDAMPKGGAVTIRTHPGGNGRVYVEVIDTGTGMDEETRRRCLEPFYTTKGERGTGLGLAMVYGVMQRHNGEIEIESAPGAGTTMRLSFAVTEARLPTASQTAAAIPTGLAILLVDDDPILLRSLREILEIDGHHITACNGGQAGIDTFRAALLPGGKPFSIVITDLGMPHVDGRTVAASVKQASPPTPVVLLTGWGERLLSEGHMVRHVDRVLSKPPRLREVRQALVELAVQRD